MKTMLVTSDDTTQTLHITAVSFAAYLKCATKSYLTAHGEKAPDSLVDEMRRRISVAYKTTASQRVRTGLTGILPIDFVRVPAKVVSDVSTLYIDCESAVYACDQRTAVGVVLGRNQSALRTEYVPVLYSAWDESDQSDNLLVCFGALEPFRKVVESVESDVIRYVVSGNWRGTTCGRTYIAGRRSARVCAIPAT